MDIDEFKKMQAALKLMGELFKGERSAKEKGWMDISDVETKIGVRQAELYENSVRQNRTTKSKKDELHRSSFFVIHISSF